MRNTVQIKLNIKKDEPKYIKVGMLNLSKIDPKYKSSEIYKNNKIIDKLKKVTKEHTFRAIDIPRTLNKQYLDCSINREGKMDAKNILKTLNTATDQYIDNIYVYKSIHNNQELYAIIATNGSKNSELAGLELIVHH